MLDTKTVTHEVSNQHMLQRCLHDRHQSGDTARKKRSRFKETNNQSAVRHIEKFLLNKGKITQEKFAVNCLCTYSLFVFYTLLFLKEFLVLH